MIDYALKEFRSLIIQLNVLSSVARVFNMRDVNFSETAVGEDKSEQLSRSLLQQVDETNMAYIGGTVWNH